MDETKRVAGVLRLSAEVRQNLLDVEQRKVAEERGLIDDLLLILKDLREG